MRKLIFVIIIALLLSLCGCVFSDISKTSEDDDIRDIDLDIDPTTPEVVRLIDESETEDTSELVIVTIAETDAESTNAESTDVEATVSETTIPENTTAETTVFETTKAPESTIKETTAEQKQNGIMVTHVSSPVGRNEMATVSIKGTPNTEYSISVYYSTAASKASGLEKKLSDDNGVVTWTWKIGGKTNSGTFSIVISGGGEEVETKFTVN